jgi:glyoxylase-like metal-dependent hydrolase (beta-lactamase superfamily II)
VNAGLRLPVNAFLAQLPEESILFDTGASNVWHPTMGSIYQSLEEAGIARDSIDTVAFTHTHIDHINGIIEPDGQLAFPQVKRVMVPEAEIELYMQEKRLSKTFAFVTPVKAGDKISIDVAAEAAIGHEVGHMAYRIKLGAIEILIWGDIIHAPSVQFASPDVTWEFDTDQDQARETRKRILDSCAGGSVIVAGAHLQFPGLGFVKRVAEGSFRFESIA